MAWWNKKLVFPVKRTLVAVAARRVKSRKQDDGIRKLHDDVQMCGYQDVQVMWEMLRRSEMEISDAPKQHKWQFWRSLESSRRTNLCDSIEQQHHHK